MTEVKKVSELEEVKIDLIQLGKEEGEDVLKGAIKIVSKLPALLVERYKWMAYLLPFTPMVVNMLNAAVDKIDGKEG